MIETKQEIKTPFLYYVKSGVFKSNAEMPNSPEGFRGWLCADHVIRNQSRHKKENVKAALTALTKFLDSLKQTESSIELIRQSDLLT